MAVEQHNTPSLYRTAASTCTYAITRNSSIYLCTLLPGAAASNCVRYYQEQQCLPVHTLLPGTAASTCTYAITRNSSIYLCTHVPGTAGSNCVRYYQEQQWRPVYAITNNSSVYPCTLLLGTASQDLTPARSTSSTLGTRGIHQFYTSYYGYPELAGIVPWDPQVAC